MIVKINQKNYEVSSNWNFREWAKLNDKYAATENLSLFIVVQKSDPIDCAIAMIMLATGLGYYEAAELLNQHVDGGGDPFELSKAFVDGISSDFFQKMMGREEKAKKVPSTKVQKKENEN
jgi:hypothetical protein